MKVTLVGGARPNWPKIAPIVRELQKRSIEFRIVHTGQHKGGALDIYDELQLPTPDEQLNVSGLTHATMTAHVLMGMADELKKHRPDWLVVVGDVNSTLGAALAAVKAGVKIAHVEAGLRSGDWTMPEEANRVLVDHMSDLCLCSSKGDVENLKNLERMVPCVHVGNVMVDSLHWALLREPKRRISSFDAFIVVTIHRPSNVDNDEAWKETEQAVKLLEREARVIWPRHPRTGKNTAVPYVDMIHLMKHALFVFTDSGGVQEETTALGTPCITWRTTTERPITITHGSNTLVRPGDFTELRRAIGECMKYLPVRKPPPALWDGHAAARVADVLLQYT